MATAIAKTQCSICSKRTRRCICEECLQNLFHSDKIENLHDVLEQAIINQKKSSLIDQIDKWEYDSIKKIKQTAEESRQILINHIDKYINEIENKLNDLIKQIKEIRQEDDFNEIDLTRHVKEIHQENDFYEVDLNQFNEKLRKLKEEFDKSIYVSIEQESTSFINKISLIISFDEDTKWKPIGLTVAGGNGQGNKLNQLSFPEGICIDDNQTIYIADYLNDRIVEWKPNVNKGRIVAGGNGKGNETSQLNYPTDIIIDEQNNCFTIADKGNRRIMRWSRQNNTTNGQILIVNIDCYGIAMDKSGSLYASDYKKNKVRRWKKGEQDRTIVAGGNEKGDKLNQLDYPTFIFVDKDYSLYISDCNNHRVMKWMKDAKEGIVVAGGNGQGNSLAQLSYPKQLFVDHLGQIYVADCGNDRVMCWSSGAKEGSIVVGRSEQGGESDQLDHPTGLSFDRESNIYVGDWGNDRIQKFQINFD